MRIGPWRLPELRCHQPGRGPVLRQLRHEPRRRGQRGHSTAGDHRSAAAAHRAPRVVSVLFADLVGFTTLSADRDPETMRELQDRYFERTRVIVDRYGGVIEKFIGDAVMAMWGAPVAHEDDAERAVRTALDLADMVPALGREAGVDLAVRVGVLTGEAAVTLGADGQGMVTGDLVNTAARLQSVAPPGGVLVGEATRLAAEAAIEFVPAGDQELKGKPAPVPSWLAVRVVGERGGARRPDALEPPFVGRNDELRFLKEQFHTVGREHRARLVSLVGQAGIGKSRLAWELEKYLDGVVEQVWWHRGRSPSYGEGVTFWALGEMIRRRAGLAEGEDEDATRVAVAAMMELHIADPTERAWIEPRILTLLGVGETPIGGRTELFAAWRTFFERLAETGTVAFVVEDLQWSDDGLLDFLEHLLDWGRSSSIFVLTLARPELLERRPGWGTDRRGAIAMRLDPLTDAAMRELLEGMAPDLPKPVVTGSSRRADGLPLYAVETIRMLSRPDACKQEGGRIVMGGGTLRADDLGALEVPPTLHALVAARLDRLPAGRPVAPPGCGDPRADVHGRGPRRHLGRDRRRRSTAPRHARPQRDPDGRDGPTRTDTRTARVRSGSRPRGRLRDAVEARAPRAPPRRCALPRITRRRGARGRRRQPFRGRLPGRPGRTRRRGRGCAGAGVAARERGSGRGPRGSRPGDRRPDLCAWR